MRRISFAQRFIASLCCFLLNVPVLAQAHTIGPNGPIPVERTPLPLPAPESVPERKPVPPPVTKPVNTPMPAPVHTPAESETTGKRKKEIYYIHTDHLNTPRAITNGEQKKVWKWGNVDPFGKNAADENPEGRGRFAFNLRFPGQYYDRETGLHYNWHRDYDPGIGRYVQSDPIGLIGGLNTYSYVINNPLRFVDPTGEIIPLFMFFGGLTGAIAGGLANYFVQKLTACESDFSWLDVFNAALWGGIGGIALPFWSANPLQAAIIGMIANLGQYATSMLWKEESVTGDALLWNAILGLVSGAAGGLFKLPSIYWNFNTALPVSRFRLFYELLRAITLREWLRSTGSASLGSLPQDGVKFCCKN